MPDMTARSELRVMIDDAYLTEHQNDPGAGGDINLIDLTPRTAFLNLAQVPGAGIPRSGVRGKFNPRYISINTNEDGQGNYGTVCGREQNEPANYFLDEIFEIANLHPCSFRTIRPNGTTARGIIIHS